jgi:hypothetical protein
MTEMIAALSGSFILQLAFCCKRIAYAHRYIFKNIIMIINNSDLTHSGIIKWHDMASSQRSIIVPILQRTQQKLDACHRAKLSVSALRFFIRLPELDLLQRIQTQFVAALSLSTHANTFAALSDYLVTLCTSGALLA